MIIRVELRCPGGVVAHEQVYYSVITAHAFVMIFFAVIPAIMGGLGN